MLAEFNWMEATTSSPIFLVLVLCSIMTVGIAVERAYYYWKRRANPDDTLARALKRIRKGEPREAAWACENCPHPMGTVALEIFKKARSSVESFEERLQIALSQQKLLLQRNLNMLGTMAAVAPLIGLLGTVWGIMRAFHDMAQTGSAAPSVVAAGVAEALVTTAAGLVVAVPALMLYNNFSHRMNVMLTVAENHTRSLRAAMAEAEENGTSPGDGDTSRDRERRSERTARERMDTREPAPTG